MIDIDHLESLAKAAAASSVWWTEQALRHATGNLVGEQDIALWATASPAAILELCAEVRRLRESIRLQANAAHAGMDAAKRHATILYAEADKARAESSPDVLASERAMNAMLTEENERLRKDKERLDFIESARPAAIDPPIGNDTNWHVLPHTSLTLEYSGATVRDAIDASRKEVA